MRDLGSVCPVGFHSAVSLQAVCVALMSVSTAQVTTFLQVPFYLAVSLSPQSQNASSLGVCERES